ncbi:MAG: hypothetical protein IJ467_07725 [Bacteroidaceae bacterium]|nr:hypothetical protein [Bacteroidaceae bacterium]
MNTFLKNLGLILIVLGAVALIACFFTGNVNNNGILASSVAAIIVGIIVHIVLNKRITE